MARKKLTRRNKDVLFRRHISNADYRKALADLLALFHAVNSHYIPSRNPYTFAAVDHANAMLFGLDGAEGTVPHWSLTEMLEQIVATRGRALLFSNPVGEEKNHRRVVCEGNVIGLVRADGGIDPDIVD